MKKYIGKKQVEAEPMTKGEAYESGLLREFVVLNTKEGNMAVFLGICPKGYDKRFHYSIAIFPGNLNYYITICDCNGIVDGFPQDEIVGYWEE